MLPDDGPWGTETCRSHIKRYFKYTTSCNILCFNKQCICWQNSFVYIQRYLIYTCIQFSSTIIQSLLNFSVMWQNLTRSKQLHIHIIDLGEWATNKCLSTECYWRLSQRVWWLITCFGISCCVDWKIFIDVSMDLCALTFRVRRSEMRLPPSDDEDRTLFDFFKLPKERRHFLTVCSSKYYLDF